MAKKKEKKVFSQTDLNLAINYMVIERVLMCMDVYEQVCYEHSILPALFEMASYGSLDKNIKNWTTDIKQKLFEELHGLLGLSREILFGEQQISLAITIDPQNAGANQFAYMYIGKLFKYSTQDFSPKEEESEMHLVAESLHQNIDSYSMSDVDRTNRFRKNKDSLIDTDISFYEIQQQLLFNPIGINSTGVFLYLCRNNIQFKIPTDFIKKYKKQGYATKKDKIWDFSFRSVHKINTQRKAKIVEKSKKNRNGIFDVIYKREQMAWGDFEDTYGKKVAWQDNVYSLDSIIYSILRNRELTFTGYKKTGDPKHRTLDDVNTPLPYPLIIKEEKSDLMGVIQAIYNHEHYMFATGHGEPMKFSSLKEEIKNSENEVKHLNARYAQIEKLPNDNVDILDKISQLVKIATEIDWFTNTYIPNLKRWESLIKNEEYDVWLLEYSDMLHERIRALEEQLNNSGGSTQRMQDAIRSQIVTLNEALELAMQSAEQKEENPRIFLREPHYEYVAINKYKKRK